jgi:alanyl-tRNA synthetase
MDHTTTAGAPMTMPATERLYFADSRRLEFESEIVARRDDERHVWFALAATAFYPEGGGQPADHGQLTAAVDDGGRLKAAIVDDVREEEGVIWHRIAAPAAAGDLVVGAAVRGRVDAARRLDHMQQHSGQHLLSALLLSHFRLDSTSFHLGEESCTIDVPVATLSPQQILALEDAAAEIIRAARPVAIHFGAAAEALAARKDAAADSAYRVIEIAGVDCCPCGGTHVGTTAEIELLTIRRLERINERRCRIEFASGTRARSELRRRQSAMRELSQTLSVEEPRLPAAAAALKERLAAAEKRAQKLAVELLAARAGEMAAAAEEVAGVRFLAPAAADFDAAAAETCGRELAARGVHAAIVTPSDAKWRVLVAVPEGAAIAAKDWLERILKPLGGRGGGSPRLAQGSLPAASAATVEYVIGVARAALPGVTVREESAS